MITGELDYDPSVAQEGLRKLSLMTRLLRLVAIVATVLARAFPILVLAAALVSGRRGGMMLVPAVVLILGRFRWALKTGVWESVKQCL